MVIRRVTTLNKGKRTPGIDKKIFVTDNQKGKLVQKLRLDEKASPIKDVYIDKPGKTLCLLTRETGLSDNVN